MAKSTVRWEQHWLPLAQAANVPIYEGDGYVATRSKNQGVYSVYSSNFGGWIRFRPHAPVQYTLWKSGFITNPGPKGGVSISWDAVDNTYSQDELAAEATRLIKTHPTDYEVVGKEAFEITKAQRLKALEEEPEPAVEPVKTEPTEAMVKAKDVWNVYQYFLKIFELTDDEKRDLEEKWAAIGVHPPTREVMATFQVGTDINDELMLAQLKTLGFTVTDITS